jgi:pyrimidine-nucleoside phosphorylase
VLLWLKGCQLNQVVTNVIAAEIIKKKRNSHSLTNDEIQFFINGYTKGEIPDYQMSALLMAIYFQGMTTEETLSLTKTMLHSGIVVDTSSIEGFKVDKHSTGGVGDKTSLILGPIVAACGLAVPMISGRGLGHTGGTLDKLEAIPGFNTQQNLTRFIEITKKIGTCFIGQTSEICPADKKIYALRDVTATVESLPLICASIMSKKLAEGIDGLVLDVKFGTGAFMKTPEKAEELAKNLMAIGQGYGKKVVSVLSSMDQPLGRFAGNAWEVYECLEIMKNKTFIGDDGYDLYSDTRELSLQLSAQMIHLSGKTSSISEAYQMAEESLLSGRALKVFHEMCQLQSGRVESLPLSKQSKAVQATASGYLQGFNVEKIGIAGITIQAGRQMTTDVIHPTSGIEFHKKIGDVVKMNDIIYTIHGDEPHLFAQAEDLLKLSYTIGPNKPLQHMLIKKVLQ